MSLVNQFVEHLYSQKKQSSRSTVKNYRADIGQFIRWYENKFHKEFDAQSVSNQIIVAYKNDKLETTSNGSGHRISVRSLDRHISSLRKFFNFLVLQGYIASNPLELPRDNQPKDDDRWQLKKFKDFLYVYNASRLTIKNYLIDVKQFMEWAEEVTQVKQGWDEHEKKCFHKN